MDYPDNEKEVLDTSEEESLEVVGEMEDGTPIVSRESMFGVFGGEAIKQAELEADTEPVEEVNEVEE